MKVSCPHCPATYNIPDEKVPLQVKKVKCRKCGGVMAIMPLKAKTELKKSEPVTRTSKPKDTIASKEKSQEETSKTGFSWLALFFAPNYYAGYGKFGRGTVFALIGCIPLTQLIVNIYAGFKAKNELPIGEQPFKWNKAILMVVIQLFIGGTVFSIVGRDSTDGANLTSSLGNIIRSSSVQGYKDIKFGMTRIEIENLPECTEYPDIYSSLHCYGKPVQIFYRTEDGGMSIDSDGGAELILVILGPYTGSMVEKYDNLLSEKYSRTRSYSLDEEELFNNGDIDRVSNIYEGGAIEFIIKRNRNGILVSIQYGSKLTSKLVMDSIPKETTSDDI